MTKEEAKAEALKLCQAEQTRRDKRDAVRDTWREEQKAHKAALAKLEALWTDDCPHKIGDRFIFSSWRSSGTWELVALVGECDYCHPWEYEGTECPETVEYEVEGIFRNVKKDGTLGKKEDRRKYFPDSPWKSAPQD